MKTRFSLRRNTRCFSAAMSKNTSYQHAYMESSIFGQTKCGSNVTLHTMRNATGMEVEVLDFGGHIRSIRVPSKNGTPTDIVIGLDSMDAYQDRNRNAYFGSIIGRYANRIARGKFSINDKEYSLAVNDGNNHLHGGISGFDQKLWQTEANIDEETKDCILTLKYISPDMEEGYPGIFSIAK